MNSGGQPPALILASASPSRAKLLEQAGIDVLIEPASVDENAVKGALRDDGSNVDNTVEALAELKALQVTKRHPGAFIIGADQILACGGIWFDKPTSLNNAREQLLDLQGKTHELITGACVVRDGERLWHHVEKARLTMLSFSEAFLDEYLGALGQDACLSVGAYQMEGLGAQLFARTEGDFFSILGLPLLPLFDFLRNNGMLAR